MVSALDIAARMKAKKKDAPEEGSDEEEATESPEEASAEGDDTTDEGDGTDDVSSYDDIENSAVQDIMNSKDPETVKAALRQFVKACVDRGEE